MGGLRRVAVVALVGILVVGCSDDGESGAGPTVPRRTTTTDPFAVPDVIDVAYVERVMAELDRLYGEAAREVAREKALTPRFEDLMRAIYADEEALAVALAVWEAERDRGFVNLADEPGDPVVDVTELIVAKRPCVVAAITRDLRPMLVTDPGPSPRQEYRALVRASAEDAVGHNVTGWALTLDGFFEEGPVTEAACESA